MKELLYNLALIDTNNFCKNHSIEYSDSHLVKAKRGYIYTLTRSNGSSIVDVTFHKTARPTHRLY